VSIVFGLLATTLMVLLVVPAMFSILDDLGVSSMARERRERRNEPLAPGKAAS